MKTISISLITGVIFCFAAQLSWGQGLKPESISIGYWGEMITHPGIKIEANYDLRNWETSKQKKNGKERLKQKSYVLSPAVGVFYHKRYQTGLSTSLNIAYYSVRDSKKTFSGGVGLGYLRTFIPNTYTISDAGEMDKVISGHNYFTGNVFVSWGRNLKQEGIVPANIYLQPQLMFAMPNFPNSTAYLVLEVGATYRLSN